MYVARAAGLLPQHPALRGPADGDAATTSREPAWALWHVLTARDRLREYHALRRFADAGGVVVSDRWPLPQLHLMDGSRVGWVLDGVRALGRGWCAGWRRPNVASTPTSALPDVLVVLRIDPEVAVSRRPEDDADYVRARNAEVFETDWSTTQAVVARRDPAPGAGARGHPCRHLGAALNLVVRVHWSAWLRQDDPGNPHADRAGCTRDAVHGRRRPHVSGRHPADESRATGCLGGRRARDGTRAGASRPRAGYARPSRPPYETASRGPSSGSRSSGSSPGPGLTAASSCWRRARRRPCGRSRCAPRSGRTAAACCPSFPAARVPTSSSTSTHRWSCSSARLGSRRSVHSRTQRLPEHERRAELVRGRELLDQLLAGPGPRPCRRRQRRPTEPVGAWSEPGGVGAPGRLGVRG